MYVSTLNGLGDAGVSNSDYSYTGEVTPPLPLPAMSAPQFSVPKIVMLLAAIYLLTRK